MHVAVAYYTFAVDYRTFELQTYNQQFWTNKLYQNFIPHRAWSQIDRCLRRLSRNHV